MDIYSGASIIITSADNPNPMYGTSRRFNMDVSQSTAAIILAAGSSSRMGAGRHKLLLPLAGRPVLAHIIDATLASQARPIIIVLGHHAAQVRTLITPFTENPTITIVENPTYLQGMSTSLHLGLQTLIAMNHQQTSITIGSTLILLGDQPLMTTRILDTL